MSSVREKIEAASEKARDIHQSAAAMHAIGMEAGYRLAIEELRERAVEVSGPDPAARDALFAHADYLESLLVSP